VLRSSFLQENIANEANKDRIIIFFIVSVYDDTICRFIQLP